MLKNVIASIFSKRLQSTIAREEGFRKLKNWSRSIRSIKKRNKSERKPWPDFNRHPEYHRRTIHYSDTRFIRRPTHCLNLELKRWTVKS